VEATPHVAAERCWRDGQVGGGDTHQHGDGVLVLGATGAEVDQGGLSAQQLGLGRDDGGFRLRARIVLVDRELQVLLIVGDRFPIEIDLLVGHAQLEIVLR
jgi:hypothetical protein